MSGEKTLEFKLPSSKDPLSVHETVLALAKTELQQLNLQKQIELEVNPNQLVFALTILSQVRIDVIRIFAV